MLLLPGGWGAAAPTLTEVLALSGHALLPPCYEGASAVASLSSVLLLQHF
jgi:hypothetical protein